MPRWKERQHNFIYKTTCLITNKFYIGMHSTDNLEDGYLGSGKILRYSIRKYGKENHELEILEFLPDRKSLINKEKEVVNESLLKDPLCINLVYGGEGGFSKESASKGAKTTNKKLWKNLEFRNKMSKLASDRMKDNWNNPEIAKKIINKSSKSFLGKKHSNETKQLIGSKNKVKQLGPHNSQYGTCWITNESENRKIHRGDVIPEGWRLGRKIKMRG
jgi:hypothetical protein